MRSIEYSTQFKKDIKLAKNRQKNLEKLKSVVLLLVNEQELPPSLKDHVLVGQWKSCRELHLEPDWLLIYTYPDDVSVRFERTGTHSDLFR